LRIGWIQGGSDKIREAVKIVDDHALPFAAIAQDAAREHDPRHDRAYHDGHGDLDSIDS
jgi:hypothetical protein